MAFPLAPVNNQKSIQDGMTFIYVAAKTRWELYDDSDATQRDLDSEYHARRQGDSELSHGHMSTVRLDAWTTPNISTYNGGAAGTLWYRDGAGIGNLGAGVGGMPFLVDGFITRDAAQTIPINAVVVTSQLFAVGEAAGVWVYIIKNGSILYRAKQVGATLTNYDATPITFDGKTYYRRDGANQVTVGGPSFFWNYYSLATLEPVYTLNTDSEYKSTRERDLLISNSLKNLFWRDQFFRASVDSDLGILYKRTDSDSRVLQSLHTELELSIDSEEHWRKAADSDFRVWQLRQDSDITYLSRWTMKLRGTVDVTKDLPTHKAIKAGDTYVVKKSGVVRSGWTGQATKGVVSGDLLMYTDSDSWIKVSGQSGVADSDHITEVQSAYNYLVTKNVTLNKLHFGKKTDTMFVEFDSDKYYLFEGSAGWGKPQMLDGVRNASNTMFVGLIGMGSKTTGVRFDYYNANGVQKQITIGTGPSGTSVTYTGNGVNVTAHGDSEFQYMGFAFASNIAIGDYLVMTASGFKSIIKTYDGVGFKRVPEWKISLDSEQSDIKVWASRRFDSEYRHGMDKDSDLRNGKLTVVRRDSYSGEVTTSYNGGAAGTLWYRNGVGIGNCGAGNGGMPFFTGGFISRDAGQTQPITAVVATTQSSFAGESAGVYLYIIRNGNVVYQAKQEGKNLTNWDNTPKIVDNTTYIQATGPVRTTVGGPVIFWHYYDLSVTKPLFHVFEDSEYKTSKERDAVLSATIKNLWLHDFKMKSDIDSDLAILFARTDSDENTLQSLHTELERSLDSEEHWRKAADSDIKVFFSKRLDSEYRLGLAKDSDLKVWVSKRLDSEYRLGLDHDSDITAIFNNRSSIVMSVPVTTLSTFVSVGGYANFSTNYASVLNVSGTTNMWLLVPTTTTGLASNKVLVVINGAVKFYGDVASTNTNKVQGSDGAWYFRGSTTNSGQQTGVSYGFRLNNVAVTTGNPYQVHYITRHKLATTVVNDRTLAQFDSDLRNDLIKLAQFANEIDSEVHLVPSLIKAASDSDRHDWKAADSDLRKILNINAVLYNKDSDIEVRGIFFNNDSEGYLRWNDVDFTLDLTINDEVTLQVGQENIIFVRNNTDSDMPNGTVVRVDGSSGAEIVVARASYDSEGASVNVLGLTTQFIGKNNGGFVTTFGKVRDLDTSAWNVGDTLYLDGIGVLTNVKPVSPKHLVTVGYVVRKHAQNGIVFVRPQNGFELEEIHDVLITTPNHQQVLGYDSDTKLWKNVSINTDFGEF